MLVNSKGVPAPKKGSKAALAPKAAGKTYIRKRGNSAGLNIPAKVLAVSGLSLNTEVKVEATEEGILIKAAEPELSLESLLANSSESKIAQSNQDAGWFDDQPQGMELI